MEDTIGSKVRSAATRAIAAALRLDSPPEDTAQLTWLRHERDRLTDAFEREILRLAAADVPQEDIAEAAGLHRTKIADRERRAGLPPRTKGRLGARPPRTNAA